VGVAAAVVDVAAADVASNGMISPTANRQGTNPMNSTKTMTLVRRAVAVMLLCLPLSTLAADQKTFATPEAAVDALMAAVKADDDAALVAIFGDTHKDLVVTPDKAANSATRATIANAMQTMRVLDARGDDRRILLIGDQAWPLPIPLVRDKGVWRFATEEGVDEVINRRIGSNERNAITVLRAYVGAQRQYASRDRDGDGVLQYAQKLGSTPGKHDGLYWSAEFNQDGEQSPFGPLIAESAAYLKGHAEGDPFRGYRFKILTRQGKSAPGGAYNYIINGRMIAGFGMVAYPARYGESGVMTFIVSNNGKIYEKDLGKASLAAGNAMTSFDPGAGWKEVTE